MKKLLTIATLAMLSSSSLVIANSGPAAPAPAPAPVAKKSPFAGLIAGAQLGYVTGYSHLTESEVRAPLRSAKTDLGGNGVLGGLNLAYNMQWNKTILGLETTFNWSGLDGTKSTIPLGGNSILHTKLSQKNVWDVAFRFGMTPAENVLVYGRLGAAFSKWESSTTNVLVGSGSGSKNLTGFLAGLGADVALSDRFSVGMQYTFTQYGSFGYNLAQQVVNRRITAKPQTNSFMLNAKFKIF